MSGYLLKIQQNMGLSQIGWNYSQTRDSWREWSRESWMSGHTTDSLLDNTHDPVQSRSLLVPWKTLFLCGLFLSCFFSVVGGCECLVLSSVSSVCAHVEGISFSSWLVLLIGLWLVVEMALLAIEVLNLERSEVCCFLIWGKVLDGMWCEHLFKDGVSLSVCEEQYSYIGFK